MKGEEGGREEGRLEAILKACRQKIEGKEFKIDGQRSKVEI